jgi:hypothetical protein
VFFARLAVGFEDLIAFRGAAFKAEGSVEFLGSSRSWRKACTVVFEQDRHDERGTKIDSNSVSLGMI